MASNQRNNRVKTASLVGWESHDKNRAKRKKLEPPQPELKMRPTISLEWDKKKKSVVSKREQIGILWRQLLSFVEPSPRGHKMLADVLSVPEEIFDLKNLSEVLSYEVWQSHLSEKERKSLSQFLPKEAEPDTVVRELLSGNNFHFGNALLRWGASLCSGELHPDNVLREEQSLKVCRKTYQSDLQKYHNEYVILLNSMIVNLQTWKEKWASCCDPEVDILQSIWRSRKCGEKTLPTSETRSYDTEEKLVTTPESCSWANSEKAYSSDNLNLGMVHGESQRRKGVLNKISDSSSCGIKVAALSKEGEKLHKRDIMHKKGAKYMSYIKVSKEMLGRVKNSMKHGGTSIPTRSLNNLLGGIDDLNVQPFERFEEEERKKLHDYWLNLVNKDISEGFATWRNRQLQRREVVWSLGEEIEQKVTIKDEEEAGSKDDPMELPDDCTEGIPCTISVEGAEKVQSCDLLQEQMDKEEHETERKTNYIFAEQTYNDLEIIEEEDDVPNVIIHDHNQQQIASLTGNPQINSTEIASLTGAKEDGNLSQVDISVSQEAPLPSACGVWPVHGSIYQSTAANDGYVPAQLSVAHLEFIREQPVQMLQQPVQMLHQEAGGHAIDSGKSVLHGVSDAPSFLDSETNQDRNEYLQSLFQARGRFPYYEEPQNSGVQFHPRYNLMMESGQFSRPLGEPVHQFLHVDPRLKISNDIYTNQNIQDSICSDGGRYAMPRPEQLPVNIHNWATPNVVRMSPRPHLNSGGFNQNWQMSENVMREGWHPTLEGSAVGVNHSFSSGSNLDQTLFSVLSECTELRPVTRPVTSYDSMGSTERIIQSGNYSRISEGIPSSSSVSHQSPNPLQYLSGHEPTINNNLGWMGFSQQNSGMHESMGKPFLRSWNQ